MGIESEPLPSTSGVGLLITVVAVLPGPGPTVRVATVSVIAMVGLVIVTSNVSTIISLTVGVGVRQTTNVSVTRVGLIMFEVSGKITVLVSDRVLTPVCVDTLVSYTCEDACDVSGIVDVRTSVSILDVESTSVIVGMNVRVSVSMMLINGVDTDTSVEISMIGTVVTIEAVIVSTSVFSLVDDTGKMSVVRKVSVITVNPTSVAVEMGAVTTGVELAIIVSTEVVASNVVIGVTDSVTMINVLLGSGVTERVPVLTFVSVITITEVTGIMVETVKDSVCVWIGVTTTVDASTTVVSMDNVTISVVITGGSSVVTDNIVETCVILGLTTVCVKVLTIVLMMVSISIEVSVVGTTMEDVGLIEIV